MIFRIIYDFKISELVQRKNLYSSSEDISTKISQNAIEDVVKILAMKMKLSSFLVVQVSGQIKVTRK